MATHSAEASDISCALPVATTRLDSPAPTVSLDEPAAELGTKSAFQHALEIISPIVAFLAVVFLTEPMAAAIRQEIPGAIAATVLIVLRVWLAYKAARYAARWVSV
jgi:hypothetical protein